MSKESLKRLARGSFKYKYMNNSAIVKVDFDQIKQNLYKKQQIKQEKLARHRSQHHLTRNKQSRFKTNSQTLATRNKKMDQRAKINIEKIQKPRKTRQNNKRKS
jgi:hypothetical protein